MEDNIVLKAVSVHRCLNNFSEGSSRNRPYFPVLGHAQAPADIGGRYIAAYILCENKDIPEPVTEARSKARGLTQPFFY
jgi:hypothetical protein